MGSSLRPPRPRLGRLLAVFALGTALACESQESKKTPEGRSELTMDMFRELVEQGTLAPVESMEDAYGGIQPQMGQTPEELSGRAPGAGPVAGEDTPQVPLREPNPYLEFGSRIKVYEDTGLIMKPYPVRKGQGVKLEGLLREYGDFLIYDPETGPQGPATVRVDVKIDFDTEMLSPDIRAPGPAPGAVEVILADWLIVTASQENLREVEYFIDLFAAGPPQIEIEAKIVEWVTRESFDWGVTPLSDADGNPIPMIDFPDHTALTDLIWNFPNQSGDTGFAAGFAAINDGTSYAAMIEVLSSFENVSIISRPKVAVREGGRAQIQAVEKIPYLEITSVTNLGVSNSKISYQEVGIRLFVTPRLIGTNTVSLEIDIEASQQTGTVQPTQVFGSPDEPGAAGSAITVPILSTRQANTVVYLRPGQAVILGGLITETTVEDEKKIPFLGDIPLLGYLFKSKFQATQKAQVLFFIRPRVLEGTDLNRKF